MILQNLLRSIVRRAHILAPKELLRPLDVKERFLFGPGPTNLLPDVKHALTLPMAGYLHPDFTKVMDEVKLGLQYIFQTKNRFTMAITGSGHAAMEACLGNLLETNDKLLVLENGLWGERAAEMGSRLGLQVSKICRQPGEVFTVEEVKQALERFEPKVLFVCQGESSTGALQPLQGLGKLCMEHDCLLLVDMVMTMGATETSIDELNIDCAYAASQKVLSCPAGLSPVTFNDRAMMCLFHRRTKPSSFYFDLGLIGNYWGCFNEERRYHHTACMPLVYAMRASLSAAVMEGLQSLAERHRTNADKLCTGLEYLGLSTLVQKPEHRLPSLTTINVPPRCDWKQVIADLYRKHNIEIAGGLGTTVGRILRIGLMGYNSTEENVHRILTAFESVFSQQNS